MRGLGSAARDCAGIGAVALPAGYAFARIGAPVPWLLGPILAGTLLAFVTHRPWTLPRPVHSFAQVLIGLAIGLSFPADAFSIIGSRLPALAVLVGLTAALSLFNGFLLWRWAGVDHATGFLGSIPGAASSMVVMGSELGADARIVTVLQYLRVMLVAILSPIAVEHLVPRIGEGAAIAAEQVVPEFAAWHLVWVITYGLIGVGLSKLLRLPAGFFLGPFLVSVAGTAITGTTLVVPDWLFSGAMMVVGASIGVQFEWTIVRRLGRIVVVQSGLVLVLMLAAALLGYVFSLVTDVPLVTAFLGSTPGAMEAMVAVSMELGADPPFVLAMQMIRFLLLLFTGPWIARWLVRRFQAKDGTGAYGK